MAGWLAGLAWKTWLAINLTPLERQKNKKKIYIYVSPHVLQESYKIHFNCKNCACGMRSEKGSSHSCRLAWPAPYIVFVRIYICISMNLPPQHASCCGLVAAALSLYSNGPLSAAKTWQLCTFAPAQPTNTAYLSKVMRLFTAIFCWFCFSSWVSLVVDL